MTKYELITFIADRLEEIHEAYALPTDYSKRHEAYVALKAEAAKHGYTGAAYTQLYNEATKIHARRMGIKDTNGKP